jgi:glycosyltransferase involved in cell wall biosynthesis
MKRYIPNIDDHLEKVISIESYTTRELFLIFMARKKMVTEENNKIVSICIPTYNGGQFIREAMNSAISQTYRPLEIVVSDDNSQDETLSIIKTFFDQTEVPIRVFHHKPEGIGANWNNCVMQAKGEYIKFLFQDDLIEPGCVEELMNLALTNKRIGLVFCKRKILYDSKNKQHWEWVSKFSDLHKNWTTLLPVQNGKTLLKDPKLLLSPSNKVGEPVAVIIKKDVFDHVGLFNKTLVQSLDYELYYRVFTKYKVGFVDKTLATFRLHDEQTTNLNREKNIEDYTLYPSLVYQNFFRYLHLSVKLKLLKRYHPLVKFFTKVISHV